MFSKMALRLSVVPCAVIAAVAAIFRGGVGGHSQSLHFPFGTISALLAFVFRA